MNPKNDRQIITNTLMLIMKRFYFSIFTTIACIGLLTFSIYQLNDLHKTAKTRQAYVSDLAYANNIRFGLLNVDHWKTALSEIIVKKIDELEFDQNLYQTMQVQVENALYDLIKQIEQYLNKDKKEGNWLTQAFKSVAYELVFDGNQFKKQVPHWSAEVVKSIASNSNKEQLKAFILGKFNEFMDDTSAPESIDIQTLLSQKYEFENYEECVAFLENEAMNLKTNAWKSTWIIVASIFLIFILWFATPSDYRNAGHYFTTFFSVIVLLLGGLLTPMIDIDVRIAEVNFELLGESIVFINQVLFFESKSIFDVVEILLRDGDMQTIAVGCLVFTFSIVFPALKLAASALAYPFPAWVNKNPIANFFALKSGKWSMADVMVIAIFMSYIGFSSLLGNQMGTLGGIKGFNVLSTHEHTSLQMGFFLFTSFCLSGMAFAYVVSHRFKQKGIGIDSGKSEKVQ